MHFSHAVVTGWRAHITAPSQSELKENRQTHLGVGECNNPLTVRAGRSRHV